MKTLADTKLACVSTVPWLLVSQLKSQIEYLSEAGVDITLISAEGHGLSQLQRSSSFSHVQVDMERSIRPLRDLSAIIRLYRLMRKHKYDIVHSTSPKAGLLAAIAAYIARVPVRLHTYTGQPWVTMGGIVRYCIRWADWIMGKLNTKCFADSSSQRQFLVDEKIVDAKKISVFGSGSLGGVDLKRFNPALMTSRERGDLKRKLSIPETSTVIIHLGRIAHDKGITELISAFRGLLRMKYDASLLMVGPLDERDVISRECREAIRTCSSICHVPYTEHPERYLAVSDLLCLPSYREGFGMVVIEAAAMSIPSVGTEIPGVVDAIADEETGILVPPRDVQSLRNALKRFLDTPDLVRRMGNLARRRSVERFDSAIVNACVAQEYEHLLKKYVHC